MQQRLRGANLQQHELGLMALRANGSDLVSVWERSSLSKVRNADLLYQFDFAMKGPAR